MKVLLSVEFPDHLAAEFIQLIRSFDAKHDPEHKDIVKIHALSEGDLTVEEMKAVFEGVEPKLPYVTIAKIGFKRS